MTSALVLALLLTAPSAVAAPPDPCTAPDDGTGTIILPPIGCDYLSPDEVHVIMDGLPPGTTIELEPIHTDFICYGSNSVCPGVPGTCELPNPINGNDDCFDSTLELQVTGTGALAGFVRTVSVPILTRVHTAARIPGDPVQEFDTEMQVLDGELPLSGGPNPVSGDADFAQLRIQAGILVLPPLQPSLGHTTLTLLPSGDFNVHSFFDVEYEIFFLGATGSVLEGLSGTTRGSLRMQAGVPFEDLTPGVPGLSIWGAMILAFLAVMGTAVASRKNKLRSA